MRFIFTLEEYRGLNGDWSIHVSPASTDELSDRFFGMELQGDALGYPVGHLKARHLGSPTACKYELTTDATLLTDDERVQVEHEARALLNREVAAFGRELDRLGA